MSSNTERYALSDAAGVGPHKSKQSGKLGGPLGLTHALLTAPHRVPLGSLKVDEGRFQVRDHNSNKYVQGILKKQESAAVSASLKEVVERGDPLDPVVYWQDPAVSDGPLWVIDGHHRMEAYEAAEVRPEANVWGQRFTGATEAEARAFALHINSREHLNMTQAERYQAFWLMLLAGEVSGSARDLEQRFNVPKSTVSRMSQQVPAVRERLRRMAAAEGDELDVGYIRESAPQWRKLSEWQANDTEVEKMAAEALEQKAIDGVVRGMAVKFGKVVQAQPDIVLKAFEQFFQEATGQALDVRRLSPEEATERDSWEF
ncbi:hypothetical protein [Burkholderia sp. BCC1988]|uniref:hypothetical protein n=1 Tax=Burkholderia sp. BCC1988 TaxID=2817443 RepID=UPI002AB076C4|nr:hypothetical protein [Burkholderia sp. BCC1988]